MILDSGVVARLEHTAALDNAAVAQQLSVLSPALDAGVTPIGGGQLVLFGRGMYVNRGLGLGLGVDVSSGDLDTLEAVSVAAGVDPEIEVCPWAQPPLLELTAERGYRLRWFRSVLIRPTAHHGDPPPAGVVTSTVVDAVGLAQWQESSAVGFGAVGADPAGKQARLVSDRYADALSRAAGTRLYLASVDGQPVGAAALTLRDGLATLSGMSTTPPARRRGVQAALLAHRLYDAAEAGCDLAMTSAVPGGVSERNLLRHGFTLAYTKVGVRRSGR